MHYKMQIMNQLWSRTEHPDEPLIAYIHSTRELMQWAIPDALKVEKAAQVLQQFHPWYGAYLHTCMYGTLEGLSRKPCSTEGYVMARREYVPLPSLELTLEFKTL